MTKNFFKSLSQKTGFIFRLDDIAPNMRWEMMDKVKKLFNTYNVKPILGVIPKNEDKELKLYPLCAFNFWDEMKNLKGEGWEIAMHGYEHVYSIYCKKNDYMGYGGNSEFVGLPFEDQLKKLNLGAEIFKKNNLKVEIFFAPNHTFDINTVKACKSLGFKSIIDGYGLTPYYENEILFIPQLFYKLYSLPFGIQTIQIHLNYFNDEDYLNLEKFVEKNRKKIISYDQVYKTASNTFTDKIIRAFIKKTLQFKRSII